MTLTLNKKISAWAIALLVMAFVSSCGGKNNTENKGGEENHHVKSETETDKAHAKDDHYSAMSGNTKIPIPNPQAFEGVSDDVKASVITLFGEYIKVKDALVSDNYKDANMASKNFIAALDNVKPDGLSEDAKKYMDEISGKMRKDAQHIIETEDIAHQRDHFFTFSQDMYAAVKAFSANNAKVYLQYCPMAFENNGAFWVSDKEEVKNPYFGKDMLNCGEVKETLEAKM